MERADAFVNHFSQNDQVRILKSLHIHWLILYTYFRNIHFKMEFYFQATKSSLIIENLQLQDRDNILAFQ